MRVAWSIFVAIVLLGACQDGPYAPPPGQFFCGSQTCELEMQYCVVGPGADGGAPVPTCGFPPDACHGVPACGCLAEVCQGSCQTGDDGSVTLTCAH